MANSPSGSAVAHGGNPQDRTASLRTVLFLSLRSNQQRFKVTIS